MADLIVLIDASGSMASRAAQISAAAAAAVEAAKAQCDVDLRLAYMGVAGVWPGTVFTVNHLNVLNSLHSPASDFAANDPSGPGFAPEQGANAIEDLSKYYNWRPEACRAIFYISDERLDGINTPQAQNAAAVANAIAGAKAHGVTVFAHHLTTSQPAWVIPQYTDLCTQTGGEAFFNNSLDPKIYREFLVKAICGACGKPRCQEANIPALEPCISVAWGDSKCDCFETDDTEIVCITVCNCYSNITFSDLTIGAVFVTLPGGGSVPLLPDGTPSVQIVPLGPTCFGDIPPCSDDHPGCVSRQFVIRTRGAKPGKYEVRLAGICYEVAIHRNLQDVFELTLCKD